VPVHKSDKKQCSQSISAAYEVSNRLQVCVSGCSGMLCPAGMRTMLTVLAVRHMQPSSMWLPPPLPFASLFSTPPSTYEVNHRLTWYCFASWS
jgi:hypothetical protein